MAYLDKFVSLYHLDNNAQDAVGSNNGTEANADYTVDAAIGSHAFLGDGIDNRTNIGHDSSLDINTAMSIGCLIKPNASSGYFAASIVNKVNGYFLSIGYPTANEYGFSVYDNAAGWRSASATGISLDTSSYHAIIGNFNGTHVKIFIDKILRGIFAYPGPFRTTAANDVGIFSYGNDAGGFLNAKGDEIFIADDALTDGGVTVVGSTATGEVAEITDLLLAGLPLDFIPSGIVTSRSRLINLGGNLGGMTKSTLNNLGGI